MNGKVKIFVLQHAPCDLPACFDDPSVFVPVQCGRLTHSAIEGSMGDDVGENISGMNADINEMTAIWWIGRHYDEIGAPEYVGFCHYRRFLHWHPDILSEDAVVACKTLSWRTVRAFFCVQHSASALKCFEDAFVAEFGREEGNSLARYFNGHVFYPCNCFLMSRGNFLSFFCFMDKCVRIVKTLIAENAVNREALGSYQKRVFGFLLERMTSYWIWREKTCGRIRVVGCDLEEFDIANTSNSIR